MLSRWLRLSGFAAAVLVAVPMAGTVDAEASIEPTTGAVRDPARTVTLVTGDKVRISEHGAPTVEPGAGRRGIRFAMSRIGGHWYVIPSDTMTPLARGRLDRRLFKVTAGSSAPVTVSQEVEDHNLTLQVRDSNGLPPSDYLMVAYGVDNGREYWGSEPDGSIDLRLPAGRYHMYAFVDEPSHTSLLTWPEYQLRGDDTVTFDARAAKPHSVRPPDPAARPRGAAVLYSYDYGDNSIGAGIYTTSLSRVRSAHVGPDVPRHRMVSGVTGAWAIRDSKGSYLRSPRGYHLAYYGYGHLLNGVTRTVRTDDLAAVKATYHSHGTGKTGNKFWYSTPAGVDLDWSYGFGLSLPLPVTRTEYLNTDGDAAWHSMLSLIGDNNVYDGDLVDRRPRQYRAGVTYRQVWNRAVSGPAFTDWSEDGAFRKGKEVHVTLSTATDGWGHPGRAYRERGSLRLYRDGVKLGESGRPGAARFTVPAGSGRFVMTGSATRYGWDHPTRWSCVWTFHAEDTPEWTGLPLLTVSLSPAVDSRNRAYDGRRQWVPVTVRSAATDDRVKVSSLTVEVSFDDGATWRKVRVVRSGQRWLADIHHPSGRKHVSLRTRAVDADGNSVKQTIIRAYGLI